MRIEEEVERWNKGTWQRLTIRYESRGIQSEKGGSINVLNHSILNSLGYEDRAGSLTQSTVECESTVEPLVLGPRVERNVVVDV